MHAQRLTAGVYRLIAAACGLFYALGAGKYSPIRIAKPGGLFTCQQYVICRFWFGCVLLPPAAEPRRSALVIGRFCSRWRLPANAERAPSRSDRPSTAQAASRGRPDRSHSPLRFRPKPNRAARLGSLLAALASNGPRCCTLPTVSAISCPSIVLHRCIESTSSSLPFTASACVACNASHRDSSSSYHRLRYPDRTL